MPEDSVTTSRGHVFTLRSINDALRRDGYSELVLEIDRHGTLTRAYIGTMPSNSRSSDPFHGYVPPPPGGDPEC